MSSIEITNDIKNLRYYHHFFAAFSFQKFCFCYYGLHDCLIDTAYAKTVCTKMYKKPSVFSLYYLFFQKATTLCTNDTEPTAEFLPCEDNKNFKDKEFEYIQNCNTWNTKDCPRYLTFRIPYFPLLIRNIVYLDNIH